MVSKAQPSESIPIKNSFPGLRNFNLSCGSWWMVMIFIYNRLIQDMGFKNLKAIH
jgi:hypothetical protein